MAVTDRWTDTALGQAGEALTAWESGEPIDVAELRAMYFRLSFGICHRSMRTDLYAALQPALLRVHDLMRRVLPPQCVPVSALAHVETRTFPDRLASVRSAWPVTRRIPLIVYARGGPLALLDGNHRLVTARSKGAACVRAVVLARHVEYERARAREWRVLDDMQRGDREHGYILT